MTTAVPFNPPAGVDALHYGLAVAWARYNSASGRASAKQVEKILKTCRPEVLARMLGERGITVQIAEAR